jgi:hypothetical protein
MTEEQRGDLEEVASSLTDAIDMWPKDVCPVELSTVKQVLKDIELQIEAPIVEEQD